jgi:hypothetical protein
MTPEEAIKAIEANYPPENYTMLREALDMAVSALYQIDRLGNLAFLGKPSPEKVADHFVAWGDSQLVFSKDLKAQNHLLKEKLVEEVAARLAYEHNMQLCECRESAMCYASRQLRAMLEEAE